MSDEHAVLWCDTHTSESAIDKMDYGLFFCYDLVLATISSTKGEKK